MRKLIKNIIKKIRKRTTRKPYKRLNEKRIMKSQNVPVTIYGTDFGIIEVKALLPVTDRIINK